MLTALPLANLDDTPARRVRAQRDEGTVEDYRRARLDQRADPTLPAFPPLRVLLDADGTHWLWDGGHRRAALLAAGDTEYPCDVEHGDLTEAVRRARKEANVDNGLRRSIEDKQAIAREICAEELDRRDRGEAPTPSRDLGALAGGTRERPALSHTFINKMLNQVREERERAAAQRAEDEEALRDIETLAPLALAAGFPRLRAGWVGPEVDLGAIDLAALGATERLGLADRLRALVARDPLRDPRPHDVLRLVGGSVAILLAGTTTWTPAIRLLQAGGPESRLKLTADEYRPLVGGAHVIQTARPIPDPLDATRDPRWAPPEGGHDWTGSGAACPPPATLLPAGWTSLESPCPDSSRPDDSTASPFVARAPAAPHATVAGCDGSATAMDTPTSGGRPSSRSDTARGGAGDFVGSATSRPSEPPTLAQLRDRTERALNRLIKAGRTFKLRADWPTGGGEQDPSIWLDELDGTTAEELAEALPIIEAADQPALVMEFSGVSSPGMAAAPAQPAPRDPRLVPERGDKVATPDDGGFVRVVQARDEVIAELTQERDDARADLAEAIERASARESELLDTIAGHEHVMRVRIRLLALTLGLPDLDWDQSIAEVDRFQRELRAARNTIGALLNERAGQSVETSCATPPAPPSSSPSSSASPISSSLSSPPSVESAGPPSPSTTDAAPAAADPSPAASPSSATGATPSDLPAWVDQVRSRLGQVPDHEIAREVGSTPSQVGKVRRQLKIPAFTGATGNVSSPEPWRSLLGWTGNAEGLTAAIDALDEQGFTDLYTHLTGVAPKKRTAKTTEAAVKSILRRWSTEAS